MSETNKSKPLNSSQLPLCEVCHLEPMPESAQYMPFIVCEVLFMFISIKLLVLLVCIGYFFSKTVWICPMCKRQVQVEGNSSTNQHIIIRLNDCMTVISKTKFRVVALIVMAIVVYLFATEPEIKPKIQIDKTWKSVSANSGFDMYLQNSFKANYFYQKYIDSGDWEITTIFLSRDQPGIKGHVTMKVKMNPSQFNDPNAEDFHVLIRKPQFNLEKGDQIKLYGRWSKRKEHIMVFTASRIEKTGQNYNPIVVDLLGKGYLRQGA